MIESISIVVDDATTVSGIAQIPAAVSSCLVLAHGAGAGMHHPYLAGVADGLETVGIATLRYQFPYMEKHSSRPDHPKICHRTVRAAVGAARELLPSVPIFAGGKSFGGRMTSQTQAESPLPGVCGLCFFGFPLHPPKKTSMTRAEHLSSIGIPMLFLQGTRDAMAEQTLMQKVVESLSETAILHWAQHADHAFHVLKRSGTTDAHVMRDMLKAFEVWAHDVVGNA